MKIYPCTEEEGIKLLEIAGFTVHLNDHTFSVWEDGKKLYGFSNRNWLKDYGFLMKNVITARSFSLGFRKGEENIRRELKGLLGIPSKKT